MVVAAPKTPNLKTNPNLRSQSTPKRPPLLPSERDNSNNNVAIAAHHRRPKSREVNSRYLSTSSSSSTSGSSSSTISNSSYFSPSSRRCPSPVPSRTGTAVPSTPAMNSNSAVKRSQSVERRQPTTPRLRGERISGEMSSTAKLLMSSSKGLSASFQGGSFAAPTGKKTTKYSSSPVASLRAVNPERKAIPSRMTPRAGGENARLIEQNQPWPGRSRPPVSSLSRSVDLGGCEGTKLSNGSTTKVVRVLQESLMGDCKLNRSMSKDDVVKGTRDDNASCLNEGSESIVSDRESVSSECNSATGSQDSSNASVGRGKGSGRSIVVSPKFWQEANGFRSKHVSESGSPVARNSLLKGGVPPKLIPPKRLMSDSSGASPIGPVSSRGISSPIRGSLRPSSPNHLGSSLRPASPSMLGTSLRSASPSKQGASLRPASPSKPGASLRSASPSMSGTSLRPETPSKSGTSLRPASPSRPATALRPVSPSKPRTTLRPASPGKPGAMLRPPSPSKPGMSLRPASPNKLGSTLAFEKASPSVGMGRTASPSRVRNAVASNVTSMPSVLRFGADVRRVRVGDSRLGDAHLLRILHNRHLQWRFVNARTEASLSFQKFNAERSLFNAWKTTSEMLEAVSCKRKELQWLKQNLKLVSILKGQMLYLEDWALMVKDHCSSLSGAIESLEASTIRLPLVGGAKGDIQDLKEAICSAADVMHAMASSICSLLEKVEDVNSLVAEVASITVKEQSFLNECKDILSMLAAMQVKDCSLRAHMLQLKCASSIMAVEV
ncbi:protein SNOWY COTYLEDON 3-like [Chenopodium quinoa]|uniref:protein SNOWY COTYLEDON 3-like n=1 Tax=Chenopodium quinoa TaxID=63459 RepID=UPI000B771F58|nr:protein SNOWY COTYLEDON 3-like [Chenopodium quinoa]